MKLKINLNLAEKFQLNNTNLVFNKYKQIILKTNPTSYNKVNKVAKYILAISLLAPVLIASVGAIFTDLCVKSAQGASRAYSYTKETFFNNKPKFNPAEVTPKPPSSPISEDVEIFFSDSDIDSDSDIEDLTSEVSSDSEDPISFISELFSRSESEVNSNTEVNLDSVQEEEPNENQRFRRTLRSILVSATVVAAITATFRSYGLGY